MVQSLRDVPPLGRWTIGLHLAWGAFVIWGFDWLGESVAVAQPVIVAIWFGTSLLFLVYGLVVASGGWRRRETRYLAFLLVFDLAPAVMVAELARVA